jgi:hypothetical protein
MLENLSTDVTFRLSKSAEFLASLLQADGKFPRLETHNNPVLHLQAASMLLTAGEFLGREDIRQAGLRASILVDDSSFEVMSEPPAACLITGDQSITSANAMSAMICLKRSKTELGERFLRAVQSSLGPEQLHFTYAKGTESPALNKLQEHHVGIASIAFLSAFRRTGNFAWLELARRVLELSLAGGRFDHLDIWAMRFIYNLQPTEVLSSRAGGLLRILNSKPEGELECPVVMLALLCNLAWDGIFTEASAKIDKLIQRLFSLHDPETGSFGEKDVGTVTRGIAAFLTVLSVKAQTRIERLDCIL